VNRAELREAVRIGMVLVGLNLLLLIVMYAVVKAP